MSNLPEYIDGLPNISGAEKEVEGAFAAAAGSPVFLADSRIDFGRIKSAFATALHMHQPPDRHAELRLLQVFQKRRVFRRQPRTAAAPASHSSGQRGRIPQILQTASDRASRDLRRSRRSRDPAITRGPRLRRRAQTSASLVERRPYGFKSDA